MRHALTRHLHLGVGPRHRLGRRALRTPVARAAPTPRPHPRRRPPHSSPSGASTPRRRARARTLASASSSSGSPSTRDDDLAPGTVSRRDAHAVARSRPAPRRKPDHVRARRPGRAQLATAPRSPRRATRSPSTPPSLGDALAAVGRRARRARPRPGSAPRAGDRSTRATTRWRPTSTPPARGPHDDAQHRRDPGEPRHRRRRRASPTRWQRQRTTSVRSSRRRSRTRRSSDGGPTGWRSTRLAVWQGDRPRPHRLRGRRTQPTARDAAWARRTRSRRRVMLVARRRRAPRSGARPLDVRRVDRPRPRARMADPRRPRVPPHHAVPAGAAARLARAAHDRRRAGAVVAGRGRGARRARTTPTPRDAMRRVPS